MVRQEKLWIMLCLAATIAGASCVPRGEALTAGHALAPVFVSDNPQSIYAADPNDSWNRIFRALFTRTVNARVSDAFPESATFVNFHMRMGSFGLRISKENANMEKRNHPGTARLMPMDFILFKYGKGVAALARADFNRTRALAERFDRSELRLNAQLLVLKPLLQPLTSSDWQE